uniref:ASX DEUBAD domain-containing protein n=1 Tax=Plectus sambesii TaxID=2011161 RepID=A0A914XKZ7_9BILA
MSTNMASSSVGDTAASSSSSAAASNDDVEKMVRLCLGGEIVQVPQSLAASEDVFRAVMTKETFDSLSADAKTYLKRFLPSSDASEQSEEKILRGAFTNDKNFYFGNALGKVHSKIRAGWFNPERPSDQVQLRDNARVLYDHYIRRYYISLLKKLLISRRVRSFLH